MPGPIDPTPFEDLKELREKQLEVIKEKAEEKKKEIIKEVTEKELNDQQIGRASCRERV